MIHLIQVVILGVLLGGVYALMASGLTLLYGVMQIVNLAHGVFILIGAYVAFSLFENLAIDPLLSVVVTAPMMFLFGVVIYRLLFVRIAGGERYTEMSVLLTFALALVLEGVLTFVFTGVFRSVTPLYATSAINLGQLFIPSAQLYASIMSVVLLVGLWSFLRFTRLGYGIRATMQNRTAAQIVGVDVTRVSTVAFGIGIGLAGASGSMIAFLFSFYPARHWQWIAILLALIVLGGLGSLKGAIVGAVALAVAAGLVGDTFGFTWSPMTFFGALFLILLIRPQGLFGKSRVA
ncbi:MAG TPA: branched-chain amino acid ABC transporter permease [Rhodothermales bacterium]|nr:branched-chain amino acid ABC transporter permease [Rhodothermales bacterium]